jgi:carbon storage regulator
MAPNPQLRQAELAKIDLGERFWFLSTHEDGAMLVLSRRQGERVIIGQEIEVTVLEIHGNRVKLGVRGPADVPICREELLRALETVSP